MEVAEVPARKSGSGSTHQSQWLQATLSGVDEKLKAILNLLEDGQSPSQSSDIQERRKEAVVEKVQDLCVSYRSLAEKYDQLKPASVDALSSGSSSPSSNARSQINHRKHKSVSRSCDDSQLETIDSNPESTVEDVDIDHDGVTHDFEHLNTFDHSLVPKDGSSFKTENAWLDREKSKMSKLVEENTQLQMELIRRNTEKREMIRKLQSQLSRLMSENNTLQRRLSYYDRNKQPAEVSSPRKAMFVDKFFRCS